MDPLGVLKMHGVSSKWDTCSLGAPHIHSNEPLNVLGSYKLPNNYPPLCVSCDTEI